MIDGHIQNTELVPNRSAHGEDSVEISFIEVVIK